MKNSQCLDFHVKSRTSGRLMPPTPAAMRSSVKPNFRVERQLMRDQHNLLGKKFCPIYFVAILLPNMISSFLGNFIKRYVLSYNENKSIYHLSCGEMVVISHI